ncbi:SH2 domain-containing protein 1A [Geospiza fortis]|uniref:SH2 domain-containing protein 1A n=1 Tax=Geospiza fortis TaxID=48883 RepID=A0A6I9Z6D8_GEOFO|nr:SH2 domain-containing protein 1A [Geospiza fortis]
MDTVPVYHGAITREAGEKLLLAAGTDGMLHALLFGRHQGYVYTYRVSQTEAGSWSAETAPGVPRRLFRKVHNLISAFQKPNQGIVTPLQNPVVNHMKANYSPGRNEGYDFHLQPS